MIVPIFVLSEGDERIVVEEGICLTAAGGGNVRDSQLAPTLSKEVEADCSQVQGQLALTLGKEVEANSRQVEGQKV